jgi:octaprenyl-diphosphate synthase
LSEHNQLFYKDYGMSETSASTLQKNQTPGELASLHHAISDELSQFKSYYKEALNTDVFLLNQILAYLSRMKGKEIRPTLVFLAAKTAGDVSERTFVAATMIELLHTATLIHDDVVDEADRRRGLFSINKIWKNKAGVLLGDFLLSKGLLISLDKNEFEMLKIVSNAVRRMSEGELRQMKASSLQNMTREKYFRIISDKTASLFSACCETGAVSANAQPEEILQMREIGELMGIAFQIQDDLLDYGSSDIGKPTGNDIQERKITLPLIEALNSSDAKLNHRIKRLFSNKKKSRQDTIEIIRFVHDSGGYDRAKQVMNEYADKAIRLVLNFPESSSRESLIGTIQFITNRSK